MAARPKAKISYNTSMLDHHLQRSIVYKLAFLPEARFSELKPDNIENKLFAYHLKKVVLAGYVEKNENDRYTLTPEGRRLGYQAIKTDQFLVDKAYSILFLIVRRGSDKAWLLFDRRTHPLLGYTTLPVATPVADLTAAQAAERDLLAKTGLNGAFTALGGGFCHVYHDSQLESFTNFTLLVCEDATGELTQQDQNGTYRWVTEPDFDEPEIFPDVSRWVELYRKGETFFTEERLEF